MIQTRINGIPCQVEMIGGRYIEPDPGTWASDIDYYGGWIDVDFEVYDMNGYLAEWLKRKMNIDDEERIVQELIQNHKENRL